MANSKQTAVIKIGSLWRRQITLVAPINIDAVGSFSKAITSTRLVVLVRMLMLARIMYPFYYLQIVPNLTDQRSPSLVIFIG